jgi:hypothetical protein
MEETFADIADIAYVNSETPLRDYFIEIYPLNEIPDGRK